MPSIPEPDDTGFDSQFREDAYRPIEGPQGPDGDQGPQGLPGSSTETVLLPHPESPEILYRVGAPDEWWPIPGVHAPGGGYKPLQLRRIGRQMFFRGACRGEGYPASLFNLPQGFQPATAYSWEAIFPGFLPEIVGEEANCHIHVTIGPGVVARVYGSGGDLLILGWESITFACYDRPETKRLVSPIQPVPGTGSAPPTALSAKGPVLALP